MASILFTSFAWLKLSPLKTAKKNKLTWPPNKKIIRFSCHTWSPQQKTLCWATFLDSLHWPPWSGLLHPGLPDCAAVHLWRGGFSWSFPAVFFPRYYWLGFLKITEQLEESGMNWTHGWHSWKFHLYVISTICLPTGSTNRWLFF